MRGIGRLVVESGVILGVVLASWIGAQGLGWVPSASAFGDETSSAAHAGAKRGEVSASFLGGGTSGEADPAARPPRVERQAAPPRTAKRDGDRTEDLEALRAKRLSIPVAGVGADRLADHFDDARGKRKHEAIDIMAPRGTPVIAVEDGTIARVYTSRAGGLTVYQFDPNRRYSYYYAHLDRYAPGLRDGAVVHRGDVLGFVGTTGNAPPDAPHLHFAIHRLGPERRWWRGEPINPYPVLKAQ